MSDWDDDSAPRERRNLVHDAMLVVAVLMLLGSFLLTETPIAPVNRPIVDDVAPLPAKADRERYADYIYEAAYKIPKLKRPTLLNFASRLRGAGAADNDTQVPIHLGYSVRELDFFGLPLFAYKDAGYVLYFDDWESSHPYLDTGMLGDEGLGLLRKEVGPDLGAGWIFPFWQHFWGWIPLLLGAGWGLLQFRRIQRRRAQLGII